MPTEAIAITNSTATGMSVSWSGVVMSLNGTSTSGPNGITENVTNAGTTASTGASRKTTLSAALGIRSSLSASFTPSASDCSRPNGPCTLGPIRCCIRATTRRSHQMLNSVSSTRIRKISSVLTPISHQGSWPKASSAMASGLHHWAVMHFASFTVTRLPGDARSASTPLPSEFAGSQTTSSGRSATSAGTVTEPRSPVSVTVGPAAS